MKAVAAIYLAGPEPAPSAHLPARTQATTPATTLFIGSITVLPPPNGVPEPATLALLGSALLGFAAMRRCKQA